MSLDEFLPIEYRTKKFDYILANPPYNGPDNSKPYFSIVEGIINRLSDTGVAKIILPLKILTKSPINKTVPTSLDSMLTAVDHRITDYFPNIAICQARTLVMITIAGEGNAGGISVVTEEDETFVAKDAMATVCGPGHYSNIMRKFNLDYATDRTRAMIKICGSRRQSGYESMVDLRDTEDSVYKYPVKHSPSTNKIIWSMENRNRGIRLFIPYFGGWDTGNMEISSSISGFCSWAVSDMGVYNKTQLVNMRSYLKTNIIRYVVMGYMRVNGSGYYDLLLKLAAVDFDKTWDDESVCNEFELTPDEIQEVEDWTKSGRTGQFAMFKKIEE